MVILAQLVLYMAAVGGVVACSLGMILFAGGAMNRARLPEVRARRWLLAALCLCGIVAAAALGFVGVPAILYLASR